MNVYNKTAKSSKEFKAVRVRMKGLEPIRHSSLDPKSNAATNYATCANVSANLAIMPDITKFLEVCR